MVLEKGERWQVLRQFVATIQRQNQRKTASFDNEIHQNNAPAHKPAIAKTKIHKLRFELVHRSPYSAVMVPSDYHMFPNLRI